MILFTIQLGSLIHLFIQKLTSRRRQQQQLTQKRARIKIANDVVKFFFPTCHPRVNVNLRLPWLGATA